MLADGDKRIGIDWPPDTPVLRRALRRVLPRKVRLQIPTIPTHLAALSVFESLRRKISEPCLDVVFDFTQCKDLTPAGITFLGALARLIRASEGRMTFDWYTCSIRVTRLLQQAGLAQMYGGPSP